MQRNLTCVVVPVVLALAVIGGTATAIVTGDLPRSAELGFRATSRDDRLVVGSVVPRSAAAQASLRENDVIVTVNGQSFDRLYVGEDLLRRLDGDVPATLVVERDGETQVIALTPPAKPFEEETEGLETLYGVVDTPDGARLRTIVTRPSGAHDPLPAVFLTQWVSCDGVELLDVDDKPWLGVIRGVAERSGAVLIRVERSSGGDSEGPGCHELDYDTELTHYRHAFEVLTQSEWVDPDRVVIWGNSLGGTLAPLVAQGHEVAGVIVAGAGALTYYERMLQFDRIGFERGDADPRRINDDLNEHARFHVEYLLHGKDPEEIAREHPELAGVWERIRGAGEGVHYGRPYSYHRQAAAKNFLAAWAAIEAPVLVVFSEYDQFEYAHGHRIIAETLNRLRPGSARYVELGRTGHSYRVFPSARHAARWERGQGAPELAIAPILDWLREVIGVQQPAPVR